MYISIGFRLVCAVVRLIFENFWKLAYFEDGLDFSSSSGADQRRLREFWSSISCEGEHTLLCDILSFGKLLVLLELLKSCGCKVDSSLKKSAA